MYTASTAEYASSIATYLDPEGDYISAVLSRGHCIKVGEEYIKDVRIIKDHQLEDIVIVDNCVVSFAYTLENGIYIPSFSGDATDSELLTLIGFLTKIAQVPDVRDYIRKFAGVLPLYERYQSLKKSQCQE